MYAEGNSTVAITGGWIENNIATRRGGAVSCSAARNTAIASKVDERTRANAMPTLR